MKATRRNSPLATKVHCSTSHEKGYKVNGLNPGVSVLRKYNVIVRVRIVLKRNFVGDSNDTSFQNYPHPGTITLYEQ